jgi:tRNA-specific 2-thiouridylase
MGADGPGVVFDAPEEAVSPGQACVLYSAADSTRVLGGGFIAAADPAMSAAPPALAIPECLP